MKKTISIFIIGVLLFGSFLWGQRIGEVSARENFNKIENHLSSMNAIGAYITHAEISEEISKGGFGHARCIADVTASAYFNQIQECLGQDGCRNLIYDEIVKSAPELLDKKNKKKFTYYGTMEKCDFSKLDRNSQLIKQ